MCSLPSSFPLSLTIGELQWLMGGKGERKVRAFLTGLFPAGLPWAGHIPRPLPVSRQPSLLVCSFQIMGAAPSLIPRGLLRSLFLLCPAYMFVDSLLLNPP